MVRQDGATAGPAVAAERLLRDVKRNGAVAAVSCGR